MYSCIACKDRACYKGQPDNYPEGCPSLDGDRVARSAALYDEPANRNLAQSAAVVEAEGYCRLTRLEETMAFAHKCGFVRLGVAFCVGMAKEAAVLLSILQNNGFEVASLVCKNGSIPKERIGLAEEQKLRPGSFEAMCNPIGQALFLNEARTELNIVFGLCVGHDSLFIKYSEAPVTVLVAKDRVLAHNPIGAIYQASSYYKKKLYK